VSSVLGQVRTRGGRTLIWIGLAVSALFAYLAVRNVDFGEVERALRESDLAWVVPSAAVFMLAVALRAVRWWLLFAPETRPPLQPVANAMLIGQFFNNVLPARAGEAARVIALNQRVRVSRAETVGTVVIERAYDVLSLLVLLFVLLPWLPDVSWTRAAAIFAIVLASSLVAAIVVLARYGDRPLHFVLRPLGRLPFIEAERVGDAARNLVHGLAGLRRAHLALPAFLLTAGSWVGFGVSAWLLMRGFHLELGVAAGILVMIAIGLAMILPSSPAALGVFEASTLVALSAYGVSDSRAFSYALVLHMVNFLPFIAAGPVALHLHARALRRRTA